MRSGTVATICKVDGSGGRVGYRMKRGREIRQDTTHLRSLPVTLIKLRVQVLILKLNERRPLEPSSSTPSSSPAKAAMWTSPIACPL